MSKELEAFKKVKNNSSKEVVEAFDIIEKGLQRLEAIDNAKPSEALNGLEYICKILNEKRIDIKWLFKGDYDTIKQALLKAQEQEKVLNIIKEYQVDIWLLKQCDYENYIRIRKEALVSVGQVVNENGNILEDEINC